MIPFYIFYSMFGFQRVGDLAWAAGDSRTRGFLLGGTAGRTTLNGEGLQHQDGHSHVLASTIPNCVSYDPTYAYELAVIVQDGLRRMIAEQEDVFYYLTVMNENYAHPAMPEGAEEGILRGMYLLREGEGDGARVQLMGSGTILREVIAGGGPAARGLRRERRRVERHRSPSCGATARRPSAGAGSTRPRSRARRSSSGAWRTARARRSRRPTTCGRSPSRSGRSCAAGATRCSGTDGFGRSDYRVKLRRFFEVDRHHVAVAALRALADEGDGRAVGRRAGDREVRRRCGDAAALDGLRSEGDG